jgi:hypothetical protein
VPTAPAILGAIRHATGVTPRQVPVLPHRLWELLRAKDSGDMDIGDRNIGEETQP